MSDLLAVVGGVAVLVGALFCTLAALGILRLPDVLTRMHAASKAGATGAGLVLCGAALVTLDIAIIVRALIGVVFLLLTTPIASHLLARAVYADSRDD